MAYSSDSSDDGEKETEMSGATEGQLEGRGVEGKEVMEEEVEEETAGNAEEEEERGKAAALTGISYPPSSVSPAGPIGSMTSA